MSWKVACARLTSARLRELWGVAGSLDVGIWGPDLCRAEAARELSARTAASSLEDTAVSPPDTRGWRSLDH